MKHLKLLHTKHELERTSSYPGIGTPKPNTNTVNPKPLEPSRDLYKAGSGALHGQNSSSPIAGQIQLGPLFAGSQALDMELRLQAFH